MSTSWIQLEVNWATSVSNALQNILHQKIPQIVLPSEEIKRAVSVFSAINEGGMKLDVYDLVVARAAQQKELSSLTQRICEKFGDEIEIPESINNNLIGNKSSKWVSTSFDTIANNIPPSEIKNCFLNMLSIISFINKGHSVGVDHIKMGKKLELEADDINKNLETTIKSLSRTFLFLQFKCGIRKISDLHYKLMIIPIANILKNDEYWCNHKAIERIEYWYWVALFSGRFREQQNQRCIEDMMQLEEWISGGDNPFKKSKRLEKVFADPGYSDFPTLIGQEKEREIPKGMRLGIIQYILSKQPRDFMVDLKLNAWDAAANRSVDVQGICEPVEIKLEDHHILPLGGVIKIDESSKKLRENKDHILNSPLNRTFILAVSNKKIGSKDFDNYKKSLAESSHWGHCLPLKSQLEKLENEEDEVYYERFLQARFDAIKKDLTEELEQLE